MYRIVIIALSLSICFASNNIQDRMDKLFQSFQNKYKIYSPEYLHKLKPLPDTKNRSFSSKDMNDLFGEWLVLEEHDVMSMYITVGSNQSMPNMLQMMAMIEAEGSVTASTNNDTTELKYFFDASMIGSSEITYYTDEAECNNNCESVCYYDSSASEFYWYCESDNEGDDGSSVIIMNLNFMEYIMLMESGFSTEGVENVFAVTCSADSTDTFMEVNAMAFNENGLNPLFADSAEVASDVVLDEVDNTITFTNLSLLDSTGSIAMSLNGTIGPEMIDLIAGVPTEMAWFDMEMTEENLDSSEGYMVFYEDSTAIEIHIQKDEDGGDLIDTSYFDWHATSDSLWLLEEAWICDGEGEPYPSEEECNDDCNTVCQYDEEGNLIPLYYEIIDDTLFIGLSEDPCEEQGFDSYDECLEDGEMGFFLGNLEDIQDFYIYSNLVMIPTGDNVSSADVIVMLEKFTIHQNYPNPFNPVTTLRYDLPENGNVNITIYDMLGREVKTLINQTQDAGYKSVIWDATNDYGKPVSAGIYLYQIQAGEYIQTKKMVLLK